MNKKSKVFVIVNSVLVVALLGFLVVSFSNRTQAPTSFGNAYQNAEDAKKRFEQYAEQAKKDFDDAIKNHETKKDEVNKAVDKFKVIVYNLTNKNLVGVYGSTSDSETWEENIIVGNIILPNEGFEVTFDDGTSKCVYDLKAVYDTGESLVETGIDICKTKTWKIYEEK